MSCYSRPSLSRIAHQLLTVPERDHELQRRTGLDKRGRNDNSISDSSNYSGPSVRYTRSFEVGYSLRLVVRLWAMS